MEYVHLFSGGDGKESYSLTKIVLSKGQTKPCMPL